MSGPEVGCWSGASGVSGVLCIWCVVYLVCCVSGVCVGGPDGGGWSRWWQLMEAIQFKGTGCRCVCWCSSCHL